MTGFGGLPLLPYPAGAHPRVRPPSGAGRGTTQGSFPTGEEAAAHGEYRPLRDAMANDKITAPEASASGAVIFIFLPVYFPAFI